MAYQREGHAQNQNCESGKAPEELVAPLQAAKACKGHWVNKFGHWPVGMVLPPVLCFPRRSQCEFSLDKRNRRRYYVSVSQQNIGYKTRKRRDSMGAWFFVAFVITHVIIIDKFFQDVNITALFFLSLSCTKFCPPIWWLYGILKFS